MTPARVSSQLREIYLRLIQTSLSVRQREPSELKEGKRQTIGYLASSALALKDVAYDRIYEELDANDIYHIKLPDGGLLVFQYIFEAEILLKHRLAFFPSPTLPTMEEAPILYQNDEMFGDIIQDRIVRFPIRFDFDPAQHRDVEHPKSHLTLGQFDNCRIPVSSAVSPNTFVTFVLRNFYARAYKRHMNRLRKHIPQDPIQRTMSLSESRITHVVCA